MRARLEQRVGLLGARPQRAREDRSRVLPALLEERSEDAARQEHDHGDEDQPFDQPPRLRLSGQNVLEVHDERGADDRAEDRLHAADDGIDHELSAALDRQRLDRDRSVVTGPQRARQAGERPGDRERGQAVERGAETDQHAAFLVLADRRQHFTELRPREHAGEQQHEGQHDRGEHVPELDVAEAAEDAEIDVGQRLQEVDVPRPDRQQRVGDRLQSVVAVRPVLRLFDDEEDHLRERQGQQREVDAVQPHGHGADEQREERRHDRSADDREPEIGMLRHRVQQQNRGDVPAGTVEHRLAVRQHAGVAEQQVERDGGDAHDEDLGCESRVAADRMQDQRKDGEAEQREGHEAQVAQGQASAPHDWRMTSLSPSNPCGRNNSTSAMHT